MARARIGYSRSMARKILKQLGVVAPPINICSIAIEEGFTIQEIHASDNRWSGQLYRSVKTIAVNAVHHEHRKRFTIAHELGHYFLGHDADDLRDETGFLGAYESGILEEDNRLPDIDKEANEFASELLIPLTMIKKDYREMSNAKRLAVRYGVSEAAMWVSLLKHGIFK